jgi:hypothetical protein
VTANELLLDDIVTLVSRMQSGNWIKALHTVASFILAAMRTDADFANDRIVHRWSAVLNKVGERMPVDPSTAATRMTLGVRLGSFEAVFVSKDR